MWTTALATLTTTAEGNSGLSARATAAGASYAASALAPPGRAASIATVDEASSMTENDPEASYLPGRDKRQLMMENDPEDLKVQGQGQSGR